MRNSNSKTKQSLLPATCLDSQQKLSIAKCVALRVAKAIDGLLIFPLHEAQG